MSTPEELAKQVEVLAAFREHVAHWMVEIGLGNFSLDIETRGDSYLVIRKYFPIGVTQDGVVLTDTEAFLKVENDLTASELFYREKHK